MTPLHLAAYNGHTEAVIFLIEQKALLETRYQFCGGSEGLTALEVAVSRKNLDLAIRMRELGARDSRGELATALAVQALTPSQKDEYVWVKLREGELDHARLRGYHPSPEFSVGSSDLLARFTFLNRHKSGTVESSGDADASPLPPHAV